MTLGRSSNRISSAERASFSEISCVFQGRRMKGFDLTPAKFQIGNLYRLWRIPKNNIKIAALNFYRLFAFIFCLLIFEMIDKNGMRRMQRRFRSRYEINICYPKFRSAWTLALEKWDFFPKLNWYYIFLCYFPC